MVLRLKQALFLAVILPVVAAGCGGSGKLGAKALSQQSKLLQSVAAEGALLAQDVVGGETIRVYTREHSADLYKAISQAEASLTAGKSAPALEPTLRELAVMAARVRTDLKRLGNASRQEARALARDLQAVAEETRKIGESLT